jgi:voltage-gated potassium channel
MRKVLMSVASDWRVGLYSLFESEKPTRTAKFLRLIIGLLILANVVAVIAESHDEIYEIYHESLYVFNVVSVVLFTIEYLLRVWVSVENPRYADLSPMRSRLKYVRSGWGLIDLAAVAPFYLGSMLPWDLRHFRALRLLRLLKLSRHFKSLEIFWHVIRTQIPILFGATLVIFILLILSSTVMYLIESPGQPDEFGNISKAMWWSVVTLTSVGYGDVVPYTPAGKITGGIIMFLGVGLVALPAAILAGKFADELQIRRERVERLVTEYLQDGELDAHEGRMVLEEGRREGLTEEQTREIAGGVRKTIEVLRQCPKCGYSEGQIR